MDATSSDPIRETGAGEQPRLPRRTVLKWIAAAAVATQLPELQAKKATEIVPGIEGGYGTDPVLNRFYAPGDVWPLTFTPAEKAAAIALADLMLPADDLGPAASTLRIHDYVDEWISAPYPQQVKDRAVIVSGLEWMDQEAQKRGATTFAALKPEQQHGILKDICDSGEAKPMYKKPAAFFQKFRDLAAGAYYGTEAGWKAIGYVGNVPLVTFEGPGPEVLEKLGVEQTVK